MKATNDSVQNAGKTAPANRVSKRALGAITEYVSRVLAASALTMWGALNLIVSIRNGIPSLPSDVPVNEIAPSDVAAADSAYITVAFVLITAVLPFLIGLNMFRKLYSQTKVR